MSFGRLGGMNRGFGHLGSPLGSAKPPPAVFIPGGLGFDTVTFPIIPTISDPGGMALATGNAGITPEAMFDLFSTARSAPTTTYFVGAGGSDANSGLNTGAKKATIGGAITAANATTTPAKIILDSMEFTRTLGLNGVSPTVDLYVTSATTRTIFGMFEASSVYAPFALDGTFTNCYSITLANADRVTNRLTQNAYGWNTDFTNYATAALLNAATLTNDSWAIDTGKLYIRRLDSAVPSYTNTRIYRATGTHNFRITSAVNIFVENLDGEGGNNGVFDYQMSAQQSTNKVFVAKNCSARYGGGTVNTAAKGFAVNGMKGLMYLYGCDGSANATDGINIHDTVSSGQMFLTVNCSGSDNGRGTSTSNNGLTCHEISLGIDLAGNYPNNRGGSVRHVNASKMLCAGTYSSDLGDVALGGATSPTAFYTDTGATMWCDRTKAGLASGGSNTAYFATTASTLHKRNAKTAGAPDGGGGTIDTY
jgi:hypothetical protein